MQNLRYPRTGTRAAPDGGAAEGLIIRTYKWWERIRRLHWLPDGWRRKSPLDQLLERLDDVFSPYSEAYKGYDQQARKLAAQAMLQRYKQCRPLRPGTFHQLQSLHDILLLSLQEPHTANAFLHEHRKRVLKRLEPDKRLAADCLLALDEWRSRAMSALGEGVYQWLKSDPPALNPLNPVFDLNEWHQRTAGELSGKEQLIFALLQLAQKIRTLPPDIWHYCDFRRDHEYTFETCWFRWQQLAIWYASVPIQIQGLRLEYAHYQELTCDFKRAQMAQKHIEKQIAKLLTKGAESTNPLRSQ